MTCCMTQDERILILGDMVDVFQRQFDAIDAAMGLAVGEEDESSLQRTMAALNAIKDRQRNGWRAAVKAASTSPSRPRPA